jgi:hypothetical protein
VSILGPEPSWFAAARDGQRVPVGPAEQAELKAYLATTTTACVATDDGCTAMLREIDRFTVQRQMESEGIKVLSCHGDLSPELLRYARDIARQTQPQQSPDRPGTS